MELWEVVARESIRDLVARYNATSDTGRFDHTMALFTDDAAMTISMDEYRGREQIRSIFTDTGEHLRSADSAMDHTYVRHSTSTHQIDLIDERRARGRCYFTVITDIGLDHWGRYVDEYACVDGTWLFASRKVTVDGQAAESRFPRVGGA